MDAAAMLERRALAGQAEQDAGDAALLEQADRHKNRDFQLTPVRLVADENVRKATDDARRIGHGEPVPPLLLAGGCCPPFLEGGCGKNMVDDGEGSARAGGAQRADSISSLHRSHLPSSTLSRHHPPRREARN
jgi:hypothetical protein